MKYDDRRLGRRKTSTVVMIRRKGWGNGLVKRGCTSGRGSDGGDWRERRTDVIRRGRPEYVWVTNYGYRRSRPDLDRRGLPVVLGSLLTGEQVTYPLPGLLTNPPPTPSLLLLLLRFPFLVGPKDPKDGGLGYRFFLDPLFVLNLCVP